MFSISTLLFIDDSQIASCKSCMTYMLPKLHILQIPDNIRTVCENSNTITQKEQQLSWNLLHISFELCYDRCCYFEDMEGPQYFQETIPHQVGRSKNYIHHYKDLSVNATEFVQYIMLISVISYIIIFNQHSDAHEKRFNTHFYGQ